MFAAAKTKGQMNHSITFTILILAVMVSHCGQRFADQPVPNQPPATYLTFFPDSSLATTTSRQILHWWGDDPDGKVMKYLFTWNPIVPVPAEFHGADPPQGWQVTTATSDTFSLKFLELDTIYIFRVSAVDDQGLVDPTPATQAFPIANSRPEVEFVPGTEIPETTFTVASFYWKGTDLDGDETIAYYQYVLDDTNSSWSSVSGATPFVNLKLPDELTNANHVFYLRAVDIAGVPSPIIRMPKKESQIWHVKRPIGKILIIDDYEVIDTDEVLYHQTLDSLGLPYSLWNIKLNRDKDNRYDLMPSSVDMFTETMLLFDRIIWYTDSKPHFDEAQIVIPRYLKVANKKILFSTQFKEFFSQQGDPLEFSPVDSLGTKSFDVFPGTLLQPDSGKPSFPILKASKWVPFVKELVPKPSAKVIYRLQENPALWAGKPAIAITNAENTFYFFGVPIHQMNANKNLKKLLAIILKDEFGLP